MRHHLALRRYAWLLTVFACCLAVAAVPSWRKLASYYTNATVHHRISVSVNTSGHDMDQVGWVYLEQSGTDQMTRLPRRLQSLAKRTGKADDWLAAATIGWEEIKSDYDKALAASPESPVVIASVLRHRMGMIGLDGPDLYRLLGQPVPHPLPFGFRWKNWHAAETLARRGMRVAPSNAYFDYMEALLRFSARRDGEALHYLHVGGTKPQYSNYTTQRRHLVFLALQDTGASAFDSAIDTTVSFPNIAAYRRFRKMARLLAYKVKYWRQKGDPQRASRILKDGIKFGVHLRDDGSGILDAEVGFAVDDILWRQAGPNPPLYVTQERRRDVYVAQALKPLVVGAGLSSLRPLYLPFALASGLVLFPWAVLFALVALALSWPARNQGEGQTQWRWSNTAGCMLTIIAAQAVALGVGWSCSLLPDHTGLTKELFLHLALPIVVTALAFGGLLFCVRMAVRSIRQTYDPFLTVAAVASGMLCIAFGVTVWLAYRVAVEVDPKSAIDSFSPWVLGLYFGAPLVGVLLYAFGRARKQWESAAAAAEQRLPIRRFLVPNFRPACATAAALCAIAGTALMPVLVHARAQGTAYMMSSEKRERALLDRLIAEADNNATKTRSKTGAARSR